MTVDMDVSAVALRALAEPQRWKIVQLLAAEELCVCHLTEELGAEQSLVSHHLKVLRDAGLVTSERYRYWTYYRLCAEALDTLAAVLIDLVASAPMDHERRRPCC